MRTDMSTHKFTAQCPFAGDYVPVVITFNFKKGAPEQGPSYSCGGVPADPDEIEFVTVGLNMTESLPPQLITMLEAWTKDYLEDEGYAEACEIVYNDIYKGAED
jgi:hypothetical protein